MFRFVFLGARQTRLTLAAVRESLREMIRHNVFQQGIRVGYRFMSVILVTISELLDLHPAEHRQSVPGAPRPARPPDQGAGDQQSSLQLHLLH